MLPEFLKSNFWFVELNQLDLDRDKALIIFQILNHGGLEDWRWLFAQYSIADIRHVVKLSFATAWFRQSLGLWQGVLDIKATASRFPDSPISSTVWGNV